MKLQNLNYLHNECPVCKGTKKKVIINNIYFDGKTLYTSTTTYISASVQDYDYICSKKEYVKECYCEQCGLKFVTEDMDF